MDKGCGKLVIMVLLGFCFVRFSSGSGTISIRFVRFDNPGGKGANGHCCDGRSFFCFGACDHLFTVCIGDQNGRTDMASCPYGRRWTGRIENANTIVFYTSIGGTPNPLTFPFNTWPGAVKLKVYIEDHDKNSNDFVDMIHTNVHMLPSPNGVGGSRRRLMLRRRTRLTVDVQVFCDNNFYGSQCDIYCESRDNHTGHYTCDRNGRNVCLAGWKGTNCDESHDDCAGNQCQNGATCLDIHLKYICICPDSFTGVYCDTDFDECTTSPCLHSGSCTNTHGSYRCTCGLPWTGSDCSTRIDFCQDAPCDNGGSCTSQDTGYTCACTNGWTGSRCDENINECNQSICLNSGECTDTNGSYTCQCAEGFSGIHCETNIDDCARAPCQYNSTCLDEVAGFRCMCSPGTTGVVCDIDIDDCDSSPCFHGATCIDELNGFSCQCMNGTIGKMCDININDCHQDSCDNGEQDDLFTIEFDRNADEIPQQEVEGYLKTVFVKSGHFDLDKLRVEMTFISENTTQTGETTSVIRIFYNGTLIPTNTMRELLPTQMLQTMKELVFAAHDPDDDDVKMFKMVSKKATNEVPWLSSHWYVVAIIVVCLLALVCLSTVAYIHHRRKHKRQEMDMSTFWPNPNELTSLGFENVVYTLDHQPTDSNIVFYDPHSSSITHVENDNE